MRNEGPFIVEWLAWYRMLGFTDVVVVTNDCTDRSPDLLDALQEAGWLFHIRRNVPPGLGITRRKLAAARKHAAVLQADWVLVCDVDEFLSSILDRACWPTCLRCITPRMAARSALAFRSTGRSSAPAASGALSTGRFIGSSFRPAAWRTGCQAT
jgi:hypothetical protein